MYDFKDAPDDIVKLKCGHAFHAQCLKDNINMGGSNSLKCPVCRADIDQEDVDKMGM